MMENDEAFEAAVANGAFAGMHKPHYVRKEVIGDCTLILGDAFEHSAGVAADAVITDPPYGIDWKPRVNHADQHEHWRDDVAFDPTPFLKIGKYHLFWGGQYYANVLPISEGWMTWVKRPIDMDFSNDNRSYATTELAWRDWGKAKFMALVWDGGMRSGHADNRTFCHPSQKPIELMEWCLRNLPSDAKHVLDPFMGSGTTGVAAARLGLKFTGIEADYMYFELACERIRRAYSQPDIFVQAEKQMEQTALALE